MTYSSPALDTSKNHPTLLTEPTNERLKFLTVRLFYMITEDKEAEIKAEATFEMLRDPAFSGKADIKLTEKEHQLVCYLSDLHHKLEILTPDDVEQLRKEVEAVDNVLTLILKSKLPEYIQSRVDGFEFSHGGGAEWKFPETDAVDLYMKNGNVFNYLVDRKNHTGILKAVPRRYQEILKKGL